MRLMSASVAVVCLTAGLFADGAQSAGATAAMPDPCQLLTKAEIDRATGRSDAMRSPGESDKLPNGSAVCTIDGGADLDIELIVYARTATTPLTPPKDGETVSGVGASAYFQARPGNAAIFAIKTLN